MRPASGCALERVGAGAAEDVVENLLDITEAVIERHEDSAKISLAAVEIVGVVASIGLSVFRRSQQLPNWFVATSLALSLATAGLMGWTANLGGQIRHTEIRAASQPSPPGAQVEKDAKEKPEVEKRGEEEHDE